MLLIVMMLAAVRGGGAARMLNRNASYCIWARREAIAHELSRARHLFTDPCWLRGNLG